MKWILPCFGVGPAECAVAGERLDRGQKSKKVRILEKVIGRSFSSHHLSTFEIGIQHARPFPTVRAAERSAHSAVPFWMLRGFGGQMVGELRKIKVTS